MKITLDHLLPESFILKLKTSIKISGGYVDPGPSYSLGCYWKFYLMLQNEELPLCANEDYSSFLGVQIPWSLAIKGLHGCLPHCLHS